MRAALLLSLAALGFAFGAFWLRRLLRPAAQPAAAAVIDESAGEVGWPSPSMVVVGLVTDFLDFLGIGSFATTTSLFRTLRMVPDALIPGTMLIGHMLPTVAQALISIAIIEVDLTTLSALILAASLGAWSGAGFVTRWPKRRIQIGMGLALLGAASLLAAKGMHWLPGGGQALGLEGWRLGAGLAGNFVFGALMNLGIGAYLPSLLLFGLLGMNLKAVFPVMMGSCAFIMAASGFRFVARARYAPRSAVGLTLGGVPGVLLAAYVVKELPLDALLWLVVGVATATAVSMLLARRSSDGTPAPGGPRGSV